MIGAGAYQADLARAVRLLENLALVAYYNPRPAADPGSIARIRAAESYKEEYQTYITLQAFDLIMDDGALMYFRRAPEDATQISYGFLECPYEALSYTSFVQEYFGSEPSGSLEAWAEYEEYRAQAPLRPHVTP